MSRFSIFELRRYRLKPGTHATLTDLFEREFIAPQQDVGITLWGPYHDLDDANAFVWFRSFANMNQRTEALQTFYGGPVWQEHRNVANSTMVNSDNVLLLKAADESEPSLCAGELFSGGLVEVTICSLAPHMAEAFAAYFALDVRPLLEQCGAKIEATFVTETAANGFPRLPVREGETVFVWVSSYADEAAWRRYCDRLEADSNWRNSIFPALDEKLWQPMQSARLVPTSRAVHARST